MNTALFILLAMIAFFGQFEGKEKTGKYEKILIEGKSYAAYPAVNMNLPDITSPVRSDDGQELVVAEVKTGGYSLVPVTVENGAPLHYSRRVGNVMGKDNQLEVDRGDFPDLFRSGLHNEEKLLKITAITGWPVDLISYIARPNRFSAAGFMAGDEDILSVLAGDNRLVRRLGFIHSRLAVPLFHVWNLILGESASGLWGRHWDRITHILYNGRKIEVKASGSKGWQMSIFQDEIQGNFDIHVRTELSDTEEMLLKKRYGGLNPDEFAGMIEQLTHIHFSEMNPYYIMRYGFYEGHTSYRCDPLAVTFVFGLKTLEEIEAAFPGVIPWILKNHHCRIPSKNDR